MSADTRGRAVRRLSVVAVVAVVAALLIPGLAGTAAAADKLTQLIGSGRQQRISGPEDEGRLRKGVPRLDVRLRNPGSVAVSSDGTVYVADFTHIYELGPDREEVRILAGQAKPRPSGEDNGDAGKAVKAYIDVPHALAVDDDTLYFVDGPVSPVRAIDLDDGVIWTLPGSARDEMSISDLALGPDGSLYASLTEGGVCRFVDDGRQCRRVVSTDIRLVNLAVGPDGTLYGQDERGTTVYAVDPKTGEATTYAGTGERGDIGDGGPATAASLGLVMDVAVRGDGTLFILDQYDHRVRAVNPESGVITTVARSQSGGSTQVEMNSDQDLSRTNWRLAVDDEGRLYLSDSASDVVWLVSNTVPFARGGDDTEGSTGAGDQSYLYLIGLLGCLVAAAVVGFVFLRHGRTESATGAAASTPAPGAPWPASGQTWAPTVESSGPTETPVPPPAPPPPESGVRRLWATLRRARKLRLTVGGLALTIVPFFLFGGCTYRESVNDLLVTYERVNLLGVAAAAGAFVVVGRLAVRRQATERPAKWRVAAVVIALVAVLQLLHATTLVTYLTPCSSGRPDSSWCGYEP